MKVLSVVGARPNLMKAAPFLRREAIEHVLVHTGQHQSQEMSGQFFDELDIRLPNYNLQIGGGSPGEQLGRTMIELEPVLSIENPDYVLVYGDVNAACASAIVAKRNGFCVAHVEAGLRSYDKEMPEEINRVLVDSVCDIHFTTNQGDSHILENEGFGRGSIQLVGNIMIDTLDYELWAASQLPLLPHAPYLEENGYVMLTLHRPSNVDNKETLEGILLALSKLDIPIVFPVHPRTKANMEHFGIILREPFVVCEPLSYHQMLRMNMSSKAILTDSGGLQEEACVLGIPCVTLRRNTERPITLKENGGTNRLVGNGMVPFHEWMTGKGNILECIDEALREERKPFRPPLWDGKTAERIEKVLRLEHQVMKSKRLLV